MMAIQLYTSRVVLATLGVVDYGVYNVVGGVVAMFGFLNSAMTSSTQRYLTFELGSHNEKKLKEVFSTAMGIHFLISVVVVVLAESVGIWFIKCKMIIPAEREFAAMCVFQLSILTTTIAIMSYPYNAAIVAHEKMSAFAYISVVEAVLKLGIVYLLLFANDVDKLILYAALIAFVQLLIRIIYSKYCTKHFQETRLQLTLNFSLFKEMLAFAGWNLWGNLASILYNQGVNMLLNVFFGPVVNAARAVSVQVQTAIHQVSNNFQMAINPQITKSYANGELTRMHELIMRSSKFTYLLLFVVCWPVFFESSFVLKMWLGAPPPYSSIFLKIILITMLIDSTSGSLTIAAAATGRVKKYQATVGGIMMLVVPIAYVVLRLGCAPYSVFIVHLIVCCAAYCVRLCFVGKMVKINKVDFCKSVVGRCLLVTIFSVSVSLALAYFQKDIDCSILNLTECFILSVFFSMLLGLDNQERNFVFNRLKRIFK